MVRATHSTLVTTITIIMSKATHPVMLTGLRNRAELAEGWYDPMTKHKADRNEQRHSHQQEHPPSELENYQKRIFLEAPFLLAAYIFGHK